MVDKLDQMVDYFKYWNNRGKSAICRYILEQLDITLEEFTQHAGDWSERKLVRTSNDDDFEVIIEAMNSGY